MNVEYRADFIAAIVKATGPITSTELQNDRLYGHIYQNWSAALTVAKNAGTVQCFTPVGKQMYYFVLEK